MSEKILPSISPKPTVFPPMDGCDNCDTYLAELRELEDRVDVAEDDIDNLERDLSDLSDEVDLIPRITVDDTLSLSSTNPVSNYVITNALNGKLDTLSAGDGITIASDTVSLKKASASTLGGIKVGSGLVIDNDGVLNATGGGGGGGAVDSVNGKVGNVVLSASDVGAVSDVKMNGSSVVTSGIAYVTDSSGNIHLNGNVYLDTNNKGIMIKNTSNVSRTALALSSSNNLGLGYGMYDANEGETRIYGNTVRLFSHNTIVANSPLIVGNHTSPIGTRYSNSFTRSVSSGGGNTWVTGSWSYELTAGTWILLAELTYDAETTGFRRAAWAYGEDEDDSATHPIIHSVMEVNTVQRSGYQTRFQSMAIVTPSSNTKYWILLDQVNTNARTLSCQVNWVITRIA